MARFITSRMTRWVERTLEGWLGLTINRTKTRVITLAPEGPATLEFLGYTFGYRWDRFGRGTRYLTAAPSTKAVTRDKDTLRALTDASRSFIPLRRLVAEVNQKPRGWKASYSFGRPRGASHVVNVFTHQRLTKPLRRRSQRACRPPAGMTYSSFLTQQLGLELL